MEYEYDGSQEYGGRVLWGRVAFFATTLVLVFFLGRCTAAGGVPASEVRRLEEQVAQLSEQKTRLEGELSAARTTVDTPSSDATESESESTGSEDRQVASDEQNSSRSDTRPSSGVPPGSKLYTVQDGDYLTKIAEEVYGDSTSERIKAITDANDLVRGTPLKVGQVLIIPPDPGEQ
jgi:nucleoid-associated protein YgaU